MSVPSKLTRPPPPSRFDLPLRWVSLDRSRRCKATATNSKTKERGGGVKKVCRAVRGGLAWLPVLGTEWHRIQKVKKKNFNKPG